MLLIVRALRAERVLPQHLRESPGIFSKVLYDSLSCAGCERLDPYLNFFEPTGLSVEQRNVWTQTNRRCFRWDADAAQDQTEGVLSHDFVRPHALLTPGGRAHWSVPPADKHETQTVHTTLNNDAFLFARNGYVVLDGVLRPKALSAFRRFLRLSTIWHLVGDGRGWFADRTNLHEGLASPLILQIAEALRK